LSYIFHFDLNNLFLTKTDDVWIQFFRYIFVGGISFIFDFTVLFLLTVYAGLHHLVSAAFAFLLGLTINFILSKFMIFTNKAFYLIHEFISCAVIGVIGLSLTLFLMYVFTDILGIYFVISKVITTSLVLIWNFVGRKIFVYRES
jgi:putative flippase GtrA